MIKHHGKLAQVHPEMPQLVDDWLAARGQSWRQLERGEIKIPGDGTPLDNLQLFLMLNDPVLFAECFLHEKPENGGGLWKLFDYQKASLRWQGDVLNKSGAGVGKTRELVILTLWGLIAREGGILIVGNADGTLEEIWDVIEFQRRKSPFIGQELPAAGIKLNPYRSIAARNGNKLRCRPTGFRGEPLRSLHINQLILGDEAAMWKNGRIYNELFRAAEHGCRVRLYSVPDGDRTCRFSKIAKQAVPFDQLTDRPAAGERCWALVQWEKPMMPPPHWGPERQDEFERRYGGSHTSGYQQNVHGRDGDPVEAVFPWSVIERRLQPLPDYRVIRLVSNTEEGILQVARERLNPLEGLSDSRQEALAQPHIIEFTDEVPLAQFDLAGQLRTYIRGLIPQTEGHLVAGVDYGSRVDPCEVLIFKILGRRLKPVLRIQMRSFGYHWQREVTMALHEVLPIDHGWGLDATGVGSAAEDEFRAALRDPEAVSGFVWNRKVESQSPETGETKEDPATHQPRRVTLLEQAISLLEHALQHGHLDFPADTDWLDQFPSYTATVSGADRRFKSKDDHLVSAAAAAILRWFLLEFGLAAPLEIQVITVPAATPGVLRGMLGGSVHDLATGPLTELYGGI